METYLNEKLYDIKKENGSTVYKLKSIFGDALEKYFPNQVILENEDTKTVVWNMNNKVGRSDDQPSVVIYKKSNDKWLVVQEKWMIGVEGSDTMIYHRDQSDELSRNKRKPAWICYYENEFHTCKFGRWYINGKLNHDYGPAEIEYDENRYETLFRWCKDGDTHSDNDKPAVIMIDFNRVNNEKITTEIWYQNGKEKRDGDKPTKHIHNESYRDDGKSADIWYKNNKLFMTETFGWNRDLGNCYHSYDGNPSRVEYHENGNRRLEEWYKFGSPHRDNDLPVAIEYYENGNKKAEQWNDEGKQSCKPCYIEYDENRKFIKHKKFPSGMSLLGANIYIEIDYDENGNALKT